MLCYLTQLNDINEEKLQGFFVGWRKPLTPAQHLHLLRNSSNIVLAYDNDKEKVVGFINALSDKVHFAFIPLLEVLPEYQNRGIGSELIRRMLLELDHITCIDLTCDEDMQPWYEQFSMLRSRGMVIRKYLTQE